MTHTELSNADRARVLATALPYIRQYNGKIVVVKYGGNAMTDDELKALVMEDIVLLHLIGVHVVLVHGGGPEIDEMLSRIGKESRFLDGLRVTDFETVDIVEMVLTGKVNKGLVSLLETKGGNAMGISGMDGSLIEARPLDERLGYVGEITHVNIKPVTDLLEKGYIPVISSIGCDRDAHVYNINADTAAACVAGALCAERLIMMTDTDGILREQSDPMSLIRQITAGDAVKLVEEGIVSGGMIPKLEACVQAIEAGVRNCVIINGCLPHSILTELLTDEGAGTMISS